MGCKGGWPFLSLAFTANFGTVQGAEYPYISGQTGLSAVCNTTGKTFYKPLVDSGYILPYDMSYSSFKDALRKGVVDVVFDVQNSFYSYASGIYQPSTDCKYSSLWSINHAMLAVGYGVSANGIEFAIIRNSWGTQWGELGYVKVAMPTTYPGVCAL